jgi:DNA-binding protein H-NS
MTTLKELMAQKAAIEQQINELKKRESGQAIAKIRALVIEYDLKREDVFPPIKSTKEVSKVIRLAPKYRDPVTGKTWAGRGKMPIWLVDKNKDDFLIP